ncbi:RNA polymerase sigma factor [Microbacterium trichothecenolyticum]|uniref:RNA polymerase sigma factor (Sigma-70 family) n=1 Tax=Microbacterium trichothecenolyticum TaxID=69370 RepID=A0ABU0TY81_MICTR|nr:RNA polymerase sigma factor [Microbacterium trichothecenolyticum]MDQ1124611.1 RNA polymerase sigma factor (sigma-70 family) [Microbacterium trichothecenolyticum]
MRRSAKDKSEARYLALVDEAALDVLRYLQRRMPTEAADLLNDALLVAWQKRARLPENVIDARMWLFGIARNLLRNGVRTEIRRSALNETLRAELTVTTAPPADDGAAIRDLIERLPPDVAEVITLVHWEGFSLADIARLQSVPSATVRGRYRRGKELLLSATSAARK